VSRLDAAAVSRDSGSTAARVLLVDDDLVLVRMHRQILTLWGYEVVGVATSGEAAVDQARQLEPDLVLMDVRLEGEIDGFEAARRIRAVRATPVVLLTGYRDPAMDNDPELGSADDCAMLEKPVRPQELRETLARLIRAP